MTGWETRTSLATYFQVAAATTVVNVLIQAGQLMYGGPSKGDQSPLWVTVDYLDAFNTSVVDANRENEGLQEDRRELRPPAQGEV